MEQQSITPYTGVQRSPATLREVFAIFFRHRRWVTLSFLATLAGVVIGVLCFGIKYRAETEILVKNQRGDEVISANATHELKSNDDLARQREINTEIGLLSSTDLLSKVVKACNLDNSQGSFWSRWLPAWGGQDHQTAKAVHTLQKKLMVQSVPDSNIIQVTYTSHDPELAASVLQNLGKFYIAKHVNVYRAPEALNFFQEQTQHYRQELTDAESRLASFNLEQNAAAPQLEKDILLKKASEFDGDLQQTQAQIAQTGKWIQALEVELAETPPRLPTQQTLSDNPQLMANLKSTLQDLEIKRTSLLEKYQPSYRPVQEVEKQIAQVRATITATQSAPMRQNTTDDNPTYQMLQSELAKAKAQLASLHAKASATTPIVQTYSKQALLLDQKQLKQDDLLRNIKTAEQNYLLYLNKSEQARISDALDNQRILNVAIAETAAVPALPVNSPWLLLIAGGILALMISMGSAFAIDYFDPSFRTPDEVIKYLDIPVLAALPNNGHAPRFALPSGDGNDAAVSHNSKAQTFMLWKRGNND